MLMSTVREEEEDLYLRNEAANRIFQEKAQAISDRQAAACQETETLAAHMR